MVAKGLGRLCIMAGAARLELGLPSELKTEGKSDMLPSEFKNEGNNMATLATQTMFAELMQRCLDAEFDETFTERGNFKKRRKGTRYYWCFQWDEDGKKRETYAGPVTDKSITDRVTRFATIKSDYKQRREMVRALLAAGLPAAAYPSGEIIEAFGRAGFFRLRGVLVGTLAYACYGSLLGVKLPAANLRTDDIDFAQFWGISENVGESMRPPLEILRAFDPTFREVPNINDPFVTTRYVNGSGFKVEFLTPNRGSDEHQSKPARMRALAGSGAQPLRHLDYLIHQPERSAILYSGGVPVTIPRAERYAVHKLIVAVERQNQVKASKDIAQAGGLIEILAVRRPLELAEAWSQAWAAGDRWKEKLTRGRERLSQEQRTLLAHVIGRAELARNRAGKR